MSFSSGLLFDGSRTLFVSPGGPDGRHYLYREEDLVRNRTCGVSGPSRHVASVASGHGARVSGAPPGVERRVGLPAVQEQR